MCSAPAPGCHSYDHPVEFLEWVSAGFAARRCTRLHSSWVPGERKLVDKRLWMGAAMDCQAGLSGGLSGSGLEWADELMWCSGWRCGTGGSRFGRGPADCRQNTRSVSGSSAGNKVDVKYR